MKTTIFNTFAFLALILISTVFACSAFDDRPEQAKQKLEKRIAEESQGAIKLLSFEKPVHPTRSTFHKEMGTTPNLQQRWENGVMMALPGMPLIRMLCQGLQLLRQKSSCKIGRSLFFPASPSLALYCQATAIPLGCRG